MATPIEFYFDYSSPYAYLASEAIEALAAKHGRAVAYKPILLGFIFKATGSAPLTEIPLKGDYSRHDFLRSARFSGIPYRAPTEFPLNTVNAARATLWLQQHAPEHVAAWVHAVFRALFVQDQNVSQMPVLLALWAGLGAALPPLDVVVADPVVRDALRLANDQALVRGIFGAPFMFIDGEPFWGNDRLPQMDRWLASGPF